MKKTILFGTLLLVSTCLTLFLGHNFLSFGQVLSPEPAYNQDFSFHFLYAKLIHSVYKTYGTLISYSPAYGAGYQINAASSYFYFLAYMFFGEEGGNIFIKGLIFLLPFLFLCSGFIISRSFGGSLYASSSVAIAFVLLFYVSLVPHLVIWGMLCHVLGIVVCLCLCSIMLWKIRSGRHTIICGLFFTLTITLGACVHPTIPLIALMICFVSIVLVEKKGRLPLALWCSLWCGAGLVFFYFIFWEHYQLLGEYYRSGSIAWQIRSFETFNKTYLFSTGGIIQLSVQVLIVVLSALAFITERKDHLFGFGLLFLLGCALLVIAYLGPWLPFFRTQQVLRLWFNAVFILLPVFILKLSNIVERKDVYAIAPFSLCLCLFLLTISASDVLKQKYSIKTSVKKNFIEELGNSLADFGFERGRVFLESYEGNLEERNPASRVGITYYQAVLGNHFPQGEYIGGPAPYCISNMREDEIIEGKYMFAPETTVTPADFQQIIQTYNIAQIVTLSDELTAICRELNLDTIEMERVGPFRIFRTDLGGGYSLDPIPRDKLSITTYPGKFHIDVEDLSINKLSIKYRTDGRWRCIDGDSDRVTAFVKGGKEWLTFPVQGKVTILEYIGP